MSATRIRRRVNAPRARVYDALLDARAVATWMVPTGMTSHVHGFDAREGGAFRISLTYDEPTAAGKTSAHTDTYHGRFVKLVPNEQVDRGCSRSPARSACSWPPPMPATNVRCSRPRGWTRTPLGPRTASRWPSPPSGTAPPTSFAPGPTAPASSASPTAARSTIRLRSLRTASSWCSSGTFNAFFNGFRGLLLEPEDRAEGGAQVAIVNADGTGFRELTSGPNNNGFPSMAPDGRRFVYRTFGPEGEGLRLGAPGESLDVVMS